PTARLRRLALGEQLVQFGTDGIAVVCDVAVHQAAGMALFAAGQAPDERTVARVVFLDAGFLLDHLWAVEPDTRLASRHQVAAQPGSDAHAAEAADRTRHHADHRLVFAQLDDGRLDLGDGGQTQVG